MRKSLVWAGALISSALLWWTPVQAQDLSKSVVGTWKLTSFVRKELASGKVANFYGETPAGYSVYTKTGRYATFVIGSERKAPAGAIPTDAERVELYKSMYAYSAKFRTEGNRLIFDIDASWNETWTGTQRSVSAELVDNKLTITSPPYKSPTDGQDIVVINTWVRID